MINARDCLYAPTNETIGETFGGHVMWVMWRMHEKPNEFQAAPVQQKCSSSKSKKM